MLAGLEHSIAAKLARGPAAEARRSTKIDARGPEGSGPLRRSGARRRRAATNRAAGARDRGARGPETGPTWESAAGPSFGHAEAGPRKRRLYRLRDGQHIAGVCAGLAAFSEVDVGLIRFLFLIGTMFSGGMLLLGYVVLMFVMPIARTEAEVAEAHGGLRPVKARMSALDAAIDLRGVTSKTFGATRAVDDLDLAVPRGAFTASSAPTARARRPRSG